MVKEFMGKIPQISKDAFVAENAVIIGETEISQDASVWFGCCLRADNDKIQIGKGSNVQDLSVIHVDYDLPCIIGENVTVGHKCIIHGAKIDDNVLVGMGSILMDGCSIGKNTIIGAGTLISAGKQIPEGVLVLGSPGKIIRELTEEEVKMITHSSESYIKKSKQYMK